MIWRVTNREGWQGWDEYAPFYDWENAQTLGRRDVPFWRRIAAGADGRVLELGCGAAQWSIQLALRGARPVGLDLSERQLEHARRQQEQAGVEFPLHQGSAEEAPFAEASFDVVFCDWGATAFTDPYRTVPEAARTLRPGGLFAFNGGTPLSWVCWDDEADATDERLRRPLFGLRRSETPEGMVLFQLPTGEWTLVLANTADAALDATPDTLGPWDARVFQRS